MAGVPATVSLYGPYSLQDQQAALVMSANNMLSHTPSSTWNCWNQTAYDAAGKSNLALGYSGADAVTGYMLDNGTNNAPVGHRRWVLYPQTQNMGTGDVSSGTFNSARAMAANALWTLDSHTYDTRPVVRDDFIAWPPKGYVPYPVVYGRWSLSHSRADFSAANVSVTKGGVNVPVSVEALHDGYGENTLVWLLQGTIDSTVWPRPIADERYTVTVSNVLLNGATRSFTYDVTIFDPATPTPNAPETLANPPLLATISNPFSMWLTPMPNASGYEVALYRLATLGAVTPTTAPSPWSYVTGPGSAYNPIEVGSFHLYHSDFATQTLTLDKKLYLAANANLKFDSGFTWATAGQVAHVQISLDDGTSWQDIYTEAGVNNLAQSTKNIDLSAYAGRYAKLRFAFAYVNGTSAYVQTNSGWYFNNIDLTNISELQDGQTQPIASNQTSASFTVGTASNYVVAARTQYQGSYFGDWGPVSVFGVGTTASTTTTTTTTSTTTTAITSTTTTLGSTTTTTLAPSGSLNLVQGWNLVGNGTDTPIDVTTAFVDTSKFVTIWKWAAAQGTWAFHAPSLAAQGGAVLKDYVASKGYQLLTTIAGGEGFWVNATQPAIVNVPNGNVISIPALSSNMVKGWNLVSVGESATPKQFCDAQSFGVTSLWAWDTPANAWYFYSPSLDASGGLGTYITGKGYLDFTQHSKTLGNGLGFWVNIP